MPSIGPSRRALWKGQSAALENWKRSIFSLNNKLSQQGGRWTPSRSIRNTNHFNRMLIS